MEVLISQDIQKYIKEMAKCVIAAYVDLLQSLVIDVVLVLVGVFSVCCISDKRSCTFMWKLQCLIGCDNELGKI